MFFNGLACERFLLPTNRAEYFRQGFLHLFARAVEAAFNPRECRRLSPRAALRDALQPLTARSPVNAVLRASCIASF
jgi:hypothetical protein